MELKTMLTPKQRKRQAKKDRQSVKREQNRQAALRATWEASQELNTWENEGGAVAIH